MDGWIRVRCTEMEAAQSPKVTRRPQRSRSPAWRRTAEGRLVLPSGASGSEDTGWDELDSAERMQRLRHAASAGAVSWACALAFKTCDAQTADPLAAVGGRWALLSSWALVFSAIFWGCKTLQSWAPDSPLAGQVQPLLEIGWPLCFGTATFAALLLVFVLLTVGVSEFDVAATWVCPLPPAGAPVAWWRVAPWTHLVVTSFAPAVLVYAEAVLREVPDGAVPDLSRSQTSRRLIVGVICGLLAYSVLSYRRSGLWAYPLGKGELNFWLATPIMSYSWWSHCSLAEVKLSPGVLLRRLFLRPLILVALAVIVGCTALMLHFVITDSKDLTSVSRWGR